LVLRSIQVLTTVATAVAIVALFVLPSTAAAQLNGDNIKGDTGLKSGSQAPPGVYIAVPLWFYTADSVKDHNGDQILTGDIDSAIYGVALKVVTPRKATALTCFTCSNRARDQTNGRRERCAKKGRRHEQHSVSRQPVNGRFGSRVADMICPPRDDATAFCDQLTQTGDTHEVSVLMPRSRISSEDRLVWETGDGTS
jgi:hypothetical protein